MGKIKSLIHKCFRQVTMNEGNKKVTKKICNIAIGELFPMRLVKKSTLEVVLSVLWL